MSHSTKIKLFRIAVTGLYVLSLVMSLGALGFLIYDYSYEQCQNSHILADIDEHISNNQNKLDLLAKEAEDPDCLTCGVEGFDDRPIIENILSSLKQDKLEKSGFGLGTYMRDFGYKVIGFAILLTLVSTLLFIYLRRKLGNKE